MRRDPAMHQYVLRSMPLWSLIILIIAVIFVSFEIGFQFGKVKSSQPQHPSHTPINAISAAVLGLLAFMLAFTFSLAASRFEARRMLVLEESNAIGTTYLRANYLPEPQRTEIRKLLRAYVDVRLLATKPEQIEEALKKSDELQKQLWAQATIVAEKHPASVMAGLFIQSLNDVIDIHAKRVMLGLRSNIPLIIWITLTFLTILSMMSIGYLTGLSGPGSYIVIITLILGFAIVISLIADLDRSREGFIQVNQQSMQDLKENMST